MCGTEFSDVLFGTPKPIDTEANLGVMNLLPIPGLDGGRFIFLLIEAVTRKKVPKDKENIVTLIGFVLVMLLMVVILFNDIKNVFFH